MPWFALLLACGVQAPEAQSPTMIELPPFEDPAVAPVYERHVTWADGQGWTATPLKRRGSRLERTWVRGEPGDGEILAPGSARVALSVFASTKATTSYGLQWSADLTDEAGRALRLLVVSGAKSVTPDQVRLDLRAGVEPPVELGAPLSWKVGERVLRTAGPSGLAEVQARLSAYVGSSFADQGRSDLDALSAVVRPVLEGGDYTVCDYGPSPGNGVPGPCIPRAPTDVEREANKAAFSAEMERRLGVLAAAADWVGLLGAVVPGR